MKLCFASLFILIFSIGFSQSYPYLNASTGNENEFPVDKDTNIYMFHGNRLVKTDKNFNTVWANTYSGFNFSSLLLSKTGSIYFLARTGSYNDVFGKLNLNGSLSWIKPFGFSATVSGTVFTSSNVNARRIILDRNNNLVVSGMVQSIGNYPNTSNSCFLKCDTNGNALKLKVFKLDYPENFSVIKDSAGIYKFIGSGNMLSGIALCIYGYSDITDAFVSYKTLGFSPGSSSVNWQLVKSKVSNNFYINAMVSTSITPQNGVIKLSEKGQLIWSKGISSSSLGPYSFYGRLEEDEKGDLLYSISCGPACTSYTSAFVKIDSNGVSNSYLTTMLSGYYIAPIYPPPIPAHSQRVIHSNNYYFDKSGYSFPMNPLTIQRFNSSFLLPCASTITAGGSSASLTFFPITVTSTIISQSSYTIAAFNTSVSPVTFSVNPNFCTVVGFGKNELNEGELIIYPNPAYDKLFISEKNYAVSSIELFDLNGKKVRTISNSSILNVGDLSNGIYFIRIKTDKGEFNKKFIKE